MKVSAVTLFSAFAVLLELVMPVIGQPFGVGCMPPAYVGGAGNLCSGSATAGGEMVNLAEVLSEDDIISMHQSYGGVTPMSVLSEFAHIPYVESQVDSVEQAYLQAGMGAGAAGMGAGAAGMGAVASGMGAIGGGIGAIGGGMGVIGGGMGAIGGGLGAMGGGMGLATGGFATGMAGGFAPMMGSGFAMMGTSTRTSGGGGGGCGCCCCQMSCETEVELQPVPVPVPVSLPVRQPPVIIEKIIPPEILTTTTTKAPLVTSTQIIVKETVVTPVTETVDAILQAGREEVNIYRPTTTVLPAYATSTVMPMYQPLPTCIPTGVQIGQINVMLQQALQGQALPNQFQVLYAQRSVGDQLNCRIALQLASGVCQAYNLNSPLGQNNWSLGGVSPIACPSTVPMPLPHCAVGAF